MKFLLGIFIIAIFTVVTEQVDYCTFKPCKGRKHIACRNTQSWDPICPYYREAIKLKKKTQNLLIQLHNEKRNLIAGGRFSKYKGACRMATMSWDNELAYLAKLNVMQCVMKHDQCRATEKFHYAGQNLGIVTYKGMPYNVTKFITNIVEGWFKENEVCKPKYIENYPKVYSGPAIGHFTAMVADRNTHLGCSASLFYQNVEGPFTFLLACNYATTNMVNFPIYKKCKIVGKNCTNKHSIYKNLCDPSEKYEVNVWEKNGVRYS